MSIEPIYYRVYFWGVTLVAVLLLSYMWVRRVRLADRGIEDDGSAGWADRQGLWLLAVAIGVVIGLRPISYWFGDMPNYQRLFHEAADCVTCDTNNLIFDNMLILLSNNGYSPHWLFLFTSLVDYLFLALACRKLWPQLPLLGFVVCLMAPDAFAYAVNGIKSGAAASIFFCAIAWRDDWRKYLPLLLLSIGFHHSMVLSAGAFMLCKFFHRPKVFLVFWVAALALACLNCRVFQELAVYISNPTGAKYLSNWVVPYPLVFRRDFVLYSMLPVFVGGWYIFRWRIASDGYRFIYSLYLLLNGIWALCMYASYTNRIAYLSWCLFPLMFSYPVLKDRRRLVTVTVATAGQLALMWYMEQEWFRPLQRLFS